MGVLSYYKKQYGRAKLSGSAQAYKELPMAKGKNKNKNIAQCHVQLTYVDFGMRRALKSTLAIFRDACSFIGEVVTIRWAEVTEYDAPKERLTFVEGLIHTAGDNDALYMDFDRKFYKFPSYYRRSAINYVLGQVSSYEARLEKYNARREDAIDQGKKFREKPPVLNLDAAPFPAMYKNEMYTIEADGTVRIKVFIRNTWDWVTLGMAGPDRKCFLKKSLLGKVLSPALVFKYNKFYLAFPIEFKSTFYPMVRLKDRIVLGIDLGVNRGAAVCVMDASGTVLGRYSGPFVSERDRMGHIINKIKRAQRESGNGNPIAALYTKLDGIKEDYARQLSRWITDIAARYNVYGIVLENLGHMRGGTKNARIHHWCKCRVRDFLKGMCRRECIRVFIINPRNTSALAFDGSGPVTRGEYKAANGEKKI